jgi:MtN3 and saliva related transmembrane protein
MGLQIEGTKRVDLRLLSTMTELPITEMIGWASSMILVLTISKQIYKQWREESSEGVSKWLFIGQVAASIGFTIYSWLVKNWVFVVTNSLMLLNAFVGLGILLRHRRRSSNSKADAQIERIRNHDFKRTIP